MKVKSTDITAAGLYYMDEMQSLAREHDNFHDIPCLSVDEAETHDATGAREGRAGAVVFTDHAALAEWRFYLCGYPPMVTTARKLAFLAGAAMHDILANPFELRDLRKIARN